MNVESLVEETPSSCPGGTARPDPRKSNELGSSEALQIKALACHVFDIWIKANEVAYGL
jgi:hypothetical protein